MTEAAEDSQVWLKGTVPVSGLPLPPAWPSQLGAGQELGGTTWAPHPKGPAGPATLYDMLRNKNWGKGVWGK